MVEEVKQAIRLQINNKTPENDNSSDLYKLCGNHLIALATKIWSEEKY